MVNCATTKAHSRVGVLISYIPKKYSNGETAIVFYYYITMLVVLLYYIYGNTPSADISCKIQKCPGCYFVKGLFPNLGITFIPLEFIRKPYVF